MRIEGQLVQAQVERLDRFDEQPDAVRGELGRGRGHVAQFGVDGRHHEIGAVLDGRLQQCGDEVGVVAARQQDAPGGVGEVQADRHRVDVGGDEGRPSLQAAQDGHGGGATRAGDENSAEVRGAHGVTVATTPAGNGAASSSGPD